MARLRTNQVLGGLAAGVLFLALGWGTGRARTRTHAGAIAPPPAATATGTAASRAKRLPPRLRALDVVVDPEEVKSWARQDVARLGAKKWTDHLASVVARRRTVGPDAASGLASYLGGWLVVVDETTPYSRQQFADSLAAELCDARPSERALLDELKPSLPSELTSICRK
jgi:hypothetical protein